MAALASVKSGLDLINLGPLMRRTEGHPEIVVGVIDGPADFAHAALSGASVRMVRPEHAPVCRSASSSACLHGTAIAGILFAKRGTPAPCLCPSCTVLLYALFPEDSEDGGGLSATSPRALANAIVETVDAGARIVHI